MKKNYVFCLMLLLSIFLVACGEEKQLTVEKAHQQEDNADLFIEAYSLSHEKGYQFNEQYNAIILSTGNLLTNYEIKDITEKNGHISIKAEEVSTFDEEKEWTSVTIYIAKEKIKKIKSVKIGKEELEEITLKP